LRLDAVELPHAEGGGFERFRPAQIAAQGEDAGEEGVERAELGGGALARDHVGFAVPRRIREVRVDRVDARTPHVFAVAVMEQRGAFEEVVVVRVYGAADVAGAARPLPGLDVDLVADETDL